LRGCREYISRTRCWRNATSEDRNGSEREVVIVDSLVVCVSMTSILGL
jgi:hypothetical protein